MPTKDEMKLFSMLIEDLAKEKKMDHMDAILFHCKQTGLEVEVAATLLTPPLKAKIMEEAQEANLLKKQSKLPI